MVSFIFGIVLDKVHRMEWACNPKSPGLLHPTSWFVD